MSRRVWRTANALTLASVTGLVGAMLALEYTVLGGEGYVFSLVPLIHLPFLAAWLGGMVAASILRLTDRRQVFAAVATTLTIASVGACLLFLGSRGSFDGEDVLWCLLCGIPVAILGLPVAYPVALALFRRQGTLTDDGPRYPMPPYPRGDLS